MSMNLRFVHGAAEAAAAPEQLQSRSPLPHAQWAVQNVRDATSVGHSLADVVGRSVTREHYGEVLVGLCPLLVHVLLLLPHFILKRAYEC